MYYNEKQLRLILFTPLLLKFVLENDVFTIDNENIKEGEFSQTGLINISSQDAIDFVNQLKIDYNIDAKLFNKLSRSIYKTILQCYNHFLDKKAKAYKIPKAITTIILSYWNFCHDIADKIEDKWIINDRNYLFFQPYIDKCHNHLEVLRILGLNTLEKNELDLANKGKTFNEDKFYRQCETKVDIIKSLIINI
jgi:hypothetical protein